MMLMAAIVWLNLVEKLKFYESLSVVLQFTGVSVLAFGVVFVIVAPVPALFPVLSIHNALRRHQRTRLIEIMWRRNVGIEKLRAQAGSRSVIEELNAVEKLQTFYQQMPVWPVNIGLFSSLLASLFAIGAPALFSYIIEQF